VTAHCEEIRRNEGKIANVIQLKNGFLTLNIVARLLGLADGLVAVGIRNANSNGDFWENSNGSECCVLT